MRALVLSGGASHGAFQVGAIQALYELGWVPDVICGSSVGAINGVGLASGKSPEEMCRLWGRVTNSDVYRWRPVHEWLQFWKWGHVLDTDPLRRFLLDHIDFEELHYSSQVVTCFSVDVVTGRLRAYMNRPASFTEDFEAKFQPSGLDVDSVMASTAIPLVFPWVRGEWDGSIRQYAPLKPAVIMGADEIVVVALEPYDADPTLPEGILQTALRILDIAALSRVQDDVRILRTRNENPDYRRIDLKVISPTRYLGYSKLSFSSPKKGQAIAHGRNRAFEIMRP